MLGPENVTDRSKELDSPVAWRAGDGNDFAKLSQAAVASGAEMGAEFAYHQYSFQSAGLNIVSKPSLSDSGAFSSCQSNCR